MLFSAHHASYNECLDAGIHCFLMAIEVSLQLDKHKNHEVGCRDDTFGMVSSLHCT